MKVVGDRVEFHREEHRFGIIRGSWTQTKQMGQTRQTPGSLSCKRCKQHREMKLRKTSSFSFRCLSLSIANIRRIQNASSSRLHASSTGDHPVHTASLHPDPTGIPASTVHQHIPTSAPLESPGPPATPLPLPSIRESSRAAVIH